MTGRSRDLGENLVRVGGVVFVLGTLATIATVVPYLLDLPRLPSIAWGLSMMMPLGLLVALVGLFATARAESRRRRAAREAAAAS
ncbi:hypothetical protein [Kitasatospora cheerisanensis]|uniref:Integral membrane protein n=1 Tax=Kitasatospora cheerisanensis KCTC 2395 TaxID=1348663 RepID=A0A066YUU6_9ACTN|nr:hypothetical protein [Kitasatospora cheerisanensis]KDN83739.1 hypothetical protein KCH_43880 [Kitasatospora cheerisanensis KCTC 2395]